MFGFTASGVAARELVTAKAVGVEGSKQGLRLALTVAAAIVGVLAAAVVVAASAGLETAARDSVNWVVAAVAVALGFAAVTTAAARVARAVATFKDLAELIAATEPRLALQDQPAAST